MAVDPVWLEGIRKKNRAKFGMGGLGGLGAGAQDIVNVLNARKAALEVTKARELEAQIQAQQQAMQTGPVLPEIHVPEVPPIPRGVLIGGGLAMLAMFGLIAWAVAKR